MAQEASPEPPGLPTAVTGTVEMVPRPAAAGEESATPKG